MSDYQSDYYLLQSLGFSNRFCNAMGRNKVTLDDALKMSEAKLMKLSGFGNTCLAELKKYKNGLNYQQVYEEEEEPIKLNFDEDVLDKLSLSFYESEYKDGQFIIFYKDKYVADFMIDGVWSIKDAKRKVLEFFAEPIVNFKDNVGKKALIEEFNDFLDSNFNLDDMVKIAYNLKNGKDRCKTLQFIGSKYNFKTLL